MKRPVLIVTSLLSVLVGGLVLGLAIGALLDPAGSLVAVVASMVWAPFGPFLLVAALLAFVSGIAARRGGLKRLGAVAALASALSLAGGGVILARIWHAAVSAGAVIDLPSVFRPARMDLPSPDVVETIRSVEGADLRAAVFLPPVSGEPAPVIVYIHGGGFMTGTFTETAADLRWFADRGWLVVSIEYRLFAPGRPTWNLAPDDAACGLAWALRNAARHGGDAGRIALLGDSAGGNLAINLGFAAAAGQVVSTCGGDMPVPKAIATLYPAVDPQSIYNRGFPIPGFEPRMLIEGYIGGPPDRHPERIEAISSSSFVTAAAPPTLIVLPQNDSLVVAEGTRAFVRDARAAGADPDLVVLPFANHIFNQVAANTLGNQIGRTLRLRFLDRHVR